MSRKLILSYVGILYQWTLSGVNTLDRAVSELPNPSKEIAFVFISKVSVNGSLWVQKGNFAPIPWAQGPLRITASSDQICR